MLSLLQLEQRARMLEPRLLQRWSVSALRDEVRVLSQHTIHLLLERDTQVWWRARKCEGDASYENLFHLIYPGSPAKTYARCQLPGSRVLYGSCNRHTALEEIGAETGDHIQLIAFRAKPGIVYQTSVIGDWQLVYAQGRAFLRPVEHMGAYYAIMDDDERYRRCVYFDSFMASHFRHKVENAYEYKVAASFSQQVFQDAAARDKPLALIYPSVQQANAFNIAMPDWMFDRFFEVLHTEYFSIEACLGYGLFEVGPVKYSDGFSAAGEIDWDAPRMRSYRKHKSFGLEEPAPMPGWRVPSARPPSSAAASD